MNFKVLILVAVSAAISASASADILRFTGTELTPAGTATIKINSGSNQNVQVGRLKFDNGGNSILTYCFDAERSLNSGAHAYSASVVNTDAPTNLGIAGRIIGNYFETATTKDQQAGLQLAIWSAIYDGQNSFTANGANFKVTNVSSSVLEWADTYYQGKNLPLSGTVLVKAFSTQVAGGQSQLTVEVVPEPASLLALSAGIAALASRRKRK